MIGKRPDCFVCKHFHRDGKMGLRCDAFPKKIPKEIMLGEPHLKPFHGQANKIVFEKFVFDKK